MFCSHCGQPLLAGAQFCGSCGRPAAAVGSSGVEDFLQGFVSVSTKEIVLLDKLTGSEILKSPVFRFLCLFALAPLAIQVFDSYSAILNGLAVWSGLLWAAILFRLFADRDLPFSWAVGTLLVTAFVVFPVFEFYLSLWPQITEWFISREFLPLQFLGFVFGVGIREEMCKAVVLLTLALFSVRMKNPMNGLVLGMMSGVGFAVSENVYYVWKTLNMSVEVTKRTGDFSSFVMPVYNNVSRMMTGPFGHGVYSGIFGYFIALAAADKSRRVPFFLAGLGIASFLHGSYNTFVGSSPLWGVLIKAFNFYVLMTYILKARGLASAKDLAGGLFQRTIMARAPAGVGRAAPASASRGPVELRPMAQPASSPADAGPTAPAPPPVEPSPTGALASPLGAWRIRGVAGPAEGKTFALEGEVHLGRDAAQCLVHLAEAVVSRQHAVLTRDSGGWKVRRLSSTGPVYVNGQAVDDVLLEAGDQLQVGSSVFLVETA